MTISNGTGKTTFGFDESNSTITGGNYADIFEGISSAYINNYSGTIGSRHWFIADTGNNSLDLNISYVGNQSISSNISTTGNLSLIHI